MPNILKYFVPGFIFVSLFVVGVDKKPTKPTCYIWSCVISFITISMLEAITILSVDDGVSWALIFIAIVIDAIVAVILSGVVRSNNWKEWVSTNFGATSTDATISYFVDWKNGTNALIALKTEECQFAGAIDTVGDGDGDGMICLYDPIKFNMAGDEIYSHEGEGVRIIIPIEDIKYIKLL